jgi:hypothetical protein
MCQGDDKRAREMDKGNSTASVPSLFVTTTTKKSKIVGEGPDW